MEATQMPEEQITWKARTTVRKYAGDIEEYRRRYGKAVGERMFFAQRKPFEEQVIEGNLLLQEGVKAIFDLLVGNAETAFNNANARIGVGNSNAAAADTQTALQGGSTAFKGMDTGYPMVGALADKKVTFRSTFGTAEANFAWEEWTVDNGATANKNLNRKVQSLGTKTSAASWQLTVEVSLA
jgi:hypothetical protein